IGRDGMSAMKIKLGIVDVRGYRERSVQNSEIKSVLRRLVDCVKPNREEKSVYAVVQDTVKRAVSETKEKDEESESDDVKPSKFGFPDIADMKDLCHRGIPLPKPGEKRDRVSVSKPSVSVPEKGVWSSAKKPSVEDLVNDERINAVFTVMGEDVTDGISEALQSVDKVTIVDKERFGGSIARVNETKCYFDVIVSMLKVVSGLFSGLDETPANVGKFRIELSDPSVVISEPYRRIRRDWAQDIYSQLLEMEKKKVIRPSVTEHHCATVIVPKKNGKLRLCVDYRPLNRVTKGMGQVLPLIDDLFQLMGGTRFYAVLDLTSGYWQVEVEESSKKYTSFVTQFGQNA
ncbi:hypothetical protein ADUPG1_001790, partial [Aduncisulcus paluster]